MVVTGLSSFAPRDARGLALLLVPTVGDTKFVHPDPTLFVLHASADAPSVDVWRDTKKVGTALVLGKLSGAIQLPPSATGYSLDLFPSGSTTRPAGAPIASLSTGELDAGQRYLGVIAGLATSPPAGKQLQLAVAHEGFVNPGPNDTSLRLRLINALGDVDSLDGGEFDASVPPVFTGISELAGLKFGAQSSEAGTVMAPDATKPVSVGLRKTADQTTLRYVGNSLAGPDGLFGVVGGMWTPAAGQQAARFVLVKVSNVGAWSVTTLIQAK
jgi:hypothetical protein